MKTDEPLKVEIEQAVREEHVPTDIELAAATKNALEWNVYVPKTVRATVTHGAVTLQGTVSWNHERHAAEWAVRDLTGVVAVHDDIVVTRAPKL